jgi:hypothetical protein
MKGLVEYKTADKIVVQVNLNHMSQHPDVLQYLEEVISKVHANEQEVVKCMIDLGRPLGYKTCVETNESDEIVYAIREGRRILTRFVKNREPILCNKVTIVLKKLDHTRYAVLTAYIGEVAEKEAGDHSIKTEEEYTKCKNFWDNHALIWGSCEIKYIAFKGVEPKLPRPIYDLRKLQSEHQEAA